MTSDFPFFHTAAGARSHMKCFVLQEYGLDLGDKVLFPKWGSWWKAYQGEVLKPNRKMKVSFVHQGIPHVTQCCFCRTKIITIITANTF